MGPKSRSRTASSAKTNKQQTQKQNSDRAEHEVDKDPSVIDLESGDNQQQHTACPSSSLRQKKPTTATGNGRRIHQQEEDDEKEEEEVDENNGMQVEEEGDNVDIVENSQGQDSTFRILIATDNHLGFLEKDPIRGDDSFDAFEEILKLAKEQKVAKNYLI
jgi:hypothetical protein